MKILAPPSDEESDSVLSELSPDEALFLSVKNNYVRGIQIAIKKGANINATDKNYLTPLMFASANNNLEVVKYLINYGANIYDADYEGRTAYVIAREFIGLSVISFFNEKYKDDKKFNYFNQKYFINFLKENHEVFSFVDEFQTKINFFG